MAPQTPLYDLASYLLGEKVGPWIRARRLAGFSWRRISLQLRDLTDDRIEVTHQTAKAWSLLDDGTEPRAVAG